METIKLEYTPVEKLEILKSLSHFSPDDYDRILEDDIFWKNKFKLDLALEKIHNGTAKLYSIEEVDSILEKTISEYEN